MGWRLPALWAIGGGLAGYLAIASAGVGASPIFTKVGDPPSDIFALRAARHRLVGLACGGVGLAAGLVLAAIRSRWPGTLGGGAAGAAVGGLAGAAIGFGPYWDIGQPPGVPLALAEGCFVNLGVLGLPAGFLSVRRPRRANPPAAPDRSGG